MRTELVTLNYPDGTTESVGCRHGGTEGDSEKWEVLVGGEVRLIDGMIARVGKNVIVMVGEAR